jgi:hypothetical protein
MNDHGTTWVDWFFHISPQSYTKRNARRLSWIWKDEILLVSGSAANEAFQMFDFTEKYCLKITWVLLSLYLSNYLHLLTISRISYA